MCIATTVFATLFVISLIIAYAGPQNECPCAGEKPDDLGEEVLSNSTGPPVPLATNGEVFPWNNVRLPSFVRPTRYNITIHPNLTTLEVKGQVTIEFHVEKDTNFIVFHSKNLTITEKNVQNGKGQLLNITRLLEYSAAQQMYLQVKEKFKRRGHYVLNLRFQFRLSRELEGFYISSYHAEDGKTKYLATTHFEPTYARSAFPCFDEPQFKARFKMSIFRDRFHIALFNMPVVNTEDAGFYMGTGLLRDDFQESVEMSTYLVAFVVCDYKRITRQTQKKVSVSVYAPNEMISQASFALSTAADAMDYYEEFFGVPYPLPKQDLIAIPDFAAGAMENWGLITYRETSIMYDVDETSAGGHQWVAVVVAHELAHQWFGNLVTMKWWNDLWLNEGFASYLEYLGVDHIMPSWKMMDQFILDKTHPALNLDALASSHPISVAVHDPVEIESIFDIISYNKGASILYMLEKFLHQETLRSGLNDYLNIHKYGNAETKDLWNVLSKHANQSLDVKTIMDTWTRQMGFPLVTISREGNTITAKQKRFILTVNLNNEAEEMNNESVSPFGYKWYVPLSYFTDQHIGKVHHIWMNMSDVKFDIPADTIWIKMNVNQSGFYRVTYSDDMWQSIISALQHNHTVFSPADRASLIDDAFTLCRAGVLNASVPLSLSLYLLHEREYVPWATALEHFQSWSKLLSESAAYKKFLEYMRRLLEPASKHVGWEDTGTHLQKLMRSDIMASAVLCDVQITVKQAQKKFRDWMDKGNRIPPNLREVVYIAGIKYGDVKDWQYCWSKYNSTGVPSERRLLLKALGVASDPWILQRYLLTTLDRNLVKPQDVKVVLAGVAVNPEGQLLAWRHLKAHWNYLQSMFGNSTYTMGTFISAVTSHFTTEYDYQEVSQFFRPMNVGSGNRALKQSLETIRLNIHWVQRNKDIINNWLNDYLGR
ncbi:endoplasmic reticulum aminopeptidase 1-like isoform X2 [Zootermopsis nevadensis]|nr:endoplasmic reticulum aminopeptidase 1-like isoform X2 [Zootermopsis nevadensis]